eukprot:gene11458-biopygen18395
MKRVKPLLYDGNNGKDAPQTPQENVNPPGVLSGAPQEPLWTKMNAERAGRENGIANGNMCVWGGGRPKRRPKTRAKRRGEEITTPSLEESLRGLFGRLVVKKTSGTAAEGARN